MRQSRRALASAQESSEGTECRRRTAGFLLFCFVFSLQTGCEAAVFCIVREMAVCHLAAECRGFELISSIRPDNCGASL